MSYLYDFMAQLSVNLAAEYARIQRRVRIDPGLAGAQGEESWAALLREWLPANYHVVTRGRVVNSQGEVSPEVDILVLHPAYPRHLLQQKYYLVAGVAAVFECKLTLKKSHLAEAAKRCAQLKRICATQPGTPAGELLRGPIFGLLAHSHTWKAGKYGPGFEMFANVEHSQFIGVEHPSEMLELICVAGTVCMRLCRDAVFGPFAAEAAQAELLKEVGARDAVVTAYVCTPEQPSTPHMGTALGNLISDLMHRLARQDPTLRNLAKYYSRAGMASAGLAAASVWRSSILSTPVRRKLRALATEADEWSDWHPRL